MNDNINKDYQEVFKCENKDDLISFVRTVENSNLNDISLMVNKSFEVLFELENLLLLFQKAINKQEDYHEDSVLINDNFDEIKEIIQKVKFKLLTIDKQKLKHQLTIDECFSDTRLVYHIINSNKEMIQ